MKNRNDIKLEELAQCCIGGVPIGLYAPFEIHKELGIIKARIKDFSFNGPADLRLNILKPDKNINDKKNNTDSNIINSSLSKTVQTAFLKDTQTQLKERLGHIESLLSDPAANCLMKKILIRDDNISFVPLDSGFLFISHHKNNALLLLDEGLSLKRKGPDSHCTVIMNFTVINAVIVLISMNLALRGGLFVHGTGVNYNGYGCLFLAPSGGGKTTLSMQSFPGAVLSDDGIIIRKHGDHYKLYPTPFRQRPGGDIHKWQWCESPVQLKAVFILEKGLTTRVLPIPRFHALRLLMNAFTHFFMYMSPMHKLRVFDFWRELSLNLPISCLRWRKGTDYLPIILDVFYKGGYKDENNRERTEMACSI
ncbi:MAG: hypothetical protein SWO11_10680 [Thermodesulfobacteriota bacterium]|nr:hypothetical protein [Thermodesulfobacteriota bacterium]